MRESRPNVSGKRFAVVAAGWHEDLMSGLIRGASAALEACGVEPSDVEVIRVPGSFEVAQGALFAAQSGRFDAVIGLGVLLRGSTLHFDLIATEAARGIASIPAQTGVPATFGIIAAENVEDARARCGGQAGNRGEEAALAAAEMVLVRNKLLDSVALNDRGNGENRAESRKHGLRAPTRG
ncbi:MAG TPA: 6,7-dimethyl-8-ribityllumazine synthase [Candidatus Eisenbacteria bacterium]|nr:6,7-dimethyl-8-ribityllumazine synthase [Candidatus Eisenbacteria bacterium]